MVTFAQINLTEDWTENCEARLQLAQFASKKPRTVKVDLSNLHPEEARTLSAQEGTHRKCRRSRSGASKSEAEMSRKGKASGRKERELHGRKGRSASSSSDGAKPSQRKARSSSSSSSSPSSSSLKLRPRSTKGKKLSENNKAEKAAAISPRKELRKLKEEMSRKKADHKKADKKAERGHCSPAYKRQKKRRRVSP